MLNIAQKIKESGHARNDPIRNITEINGPGTAIENLAFFKENGFKYCIPNLAFYFENTLENCKFTQ